jgi:pyruvate/2-oxoglutarate dehydrogenase complex dihydrolipoamide acyltransferase (E2) component
MKITMKLPRIGMNMEEATIVKWHKQPGEAFKTGDILYEIETEKVSQEFAATADGTLLEQCVAEGDNVPVGGRVCVVEVTAPGKA